MQGDKRTGNPDALIKIGVRITAENLTLLQELAATVKTTPSAILRTIIKDFEIRNRKYLTKITDGKYADNTGNGEEDPEEEIW
jgi:predicted transcriptional regulator